MLECRPTCIERAVEHRQNAAGGMRVIHRRAEYEAIGLLGGFDELINHVVIEYARAIELAALTATDAITHGGSAQLEHLPFDAVAFKRRTNFGERRRRIALRLRAAIDHKNLHESPFIQRTAPTDSINRRFEFTYLTPCLV